MRVGLRGILRILYPKTYGEVKSYKEFFAVWGTSTALDER